MEYTTLGETGMEVSRICLGCMSFGDGEPWMLEGEDADEIVDRAVDLGINFFDTANAYSGGESERILGDALSAYDRDEQVVATKVFFPVEDGPNRSGLSRKTVEQELDNSLDRLGMDCVDLYQIHRWDDDTPIEETLRALDDAVRRGKVRYLGASSMWAYQFAEALHTSEVEHLERFATMQNHYNVAYREEEREMLPLCEREAIGVVPWGPLGQGYLARPHEDLETTTRSDPSNVHNPTPEYGRAGGETVNERVEELAEEYGVTMAQLSLAWLFSKEWVDAPIVGTTSVQHLEEAVEALDVDLSESDVAYLEEPYEPKPVIGHS
ncbi:aldo/keto reductase [Halomarina oriensis]|uniref:Aldo/keto reductase n=1 Tax=Halomarina oriensis TaxID=671145 RepID=A0A6B0GFK3_9EURY|nr:aldo/keto reductase [Halomarina oriensis]MWG33484.1 aldo/keto reductase [Halomarina oriensis]